MAGIVSPPEPIVKAKVRLELPSDLYDKYVAHAKTSEREPEEEMVERLKRCVDHTAARGIYLDDTHRKELESATGRLITTPEQAVQRLKELSAIMVGDVIVDIPQRLQSRLLSRAKACRKEYEEFIKKEIGEALERVAGLRPW